MYPENRLACLEETTTYTEYTFAEAEGCVRTDYTRTDLVDPTGLDPEDLI